MTQTVDKEIWALKKGMKTENANATILYKIQKIFFKNSVLLEGKNTSKRILSFNLYTSAAVVAFKLYGGMVDCCSTPSAINTTSKYKNMFTNSYFIQEVSFLVPKFHHPIR